MLDAKQAVTKAVEFSLEFEGKFLPVENPLLEGVESDDTDNWLVTLSFALPDEPKLEEKINEMSPLGSWARAERLRKAPRIYRQFRVDGKEGKVVSMKPVKID